MMLRRFVAVAGAALAVLSSIPAGSAGGDDDRSKYGLDTPVLPVDRFSDAAGTLLRRSEIPSLPGPNEAIDLDRPPFALTLAGPDGSLRRCYDLDVRPAKPSRYYVFYDRVGNYQLGQFPVVDAAPGDPGYSDLWDIIKVIVPDGFEPFNRIRDAATVERLLADPKSRYTTQRTGILLNGPVVPEGTSASLKADNREGSATLLYAWYRGKRAPYLYFEGSLRAEGDSSPVALMQFPGGSPGVPLGLALADGKTKPTIDAVPKGPGYSPLHRVVGPDGRPLLDGWLNCPVVGTAP
ncbi:MAG: hypothetical protein LAO51_00370 [Acidobacteriia bacterium]|nr:hypothetical protein [Terriglobia bacterium]